MEFVRTELNSEVHSDWLKMMMMVFEDVEGLNLVFGTQLDCFLFVSVVVLTMGERDDPAWDSLMIDSSVVEAVGALEHSEVSDSEQGCHLTLEGRDPVEISVVEKCPAYFQKLPF